MSGLTNLTHLDLNWTEVSDAGLAQLNGLTNLRGLFLHRTLITDAGADSRACLSGARRYDWLRCIFPVPTQGIAMSDAAAMPSDLSAVFDRYKERLRRTVRLRLDRRLTGIVDSSGVLKLAREEVEREGRRPGRLGDRDIPLAPPDRRRGLAADSPGAARARRAGRHLALPGRFAGGHVGLAGRSSAGQGGEEDQAAARAEQKIMLQETLNAMDADRPRGVDSPALRAALQRRDRGRAGNLAGRGQRSLRSRT